MSIKFNDSVMTTLKRIDMMDEPCAQKKHFLQCEVRSQHLLIAMHRKGFGPIPVPRARRDWHLLDLPFLLHGFLQCYQTMSMEHCRTHPWYGTSVTQKQDPIVSLVFLTMVCEPMTAKLQF